MNQNKKGALANIINKKLFIEKSRYFLLYFCTMFAFCCINMNLLSGYSILNNVFFQYHSFSNRKMSASSSTGNFRRKCSNFSMSSTADRRHGADRSEAAIVLP